MPAILTPIALLLACLPARCYDTPDVAIGLLAFFKEARSITISSPAGLKLSAAEDTGPSVAIVPDGYWADDPARPLEVRNIPPGWQVRIFDTSGLQVRAYTNTGDTAVNWEWDFENGHGHPVAKSMYLVRVLDGGGAVKKTGKFVVQTAAR